MFKTKTASSRKLGAVEKRAGRKEPGRPLVFAKAFAYLSALALVLPAPALAYIDPGLGGMMMQIMAAAAISVLIFWRNLRMKIKSLFTGNRAGSAPAETSEKTSPPDDSTPER